MEHLESIVKLADAELGSIEKNGKFRSREEIDSVYKLMDIVKDAYCIMDMEDGDYSEYDGGSYRGSYNMGGSSYARGRSRNARRDSMGRYSRNDGRSYRVGYARNDGYSRGGNNEYIESLREMMEDAPDETTRQGIQRMIQQMEQG